MSLATDYLKSKDKILATILDDSLDETSFDILNINSKEQIITKVYQALLSSIISQQISVAAANSIKNKIKALYGGELPSIQILSLENIANLRLAGVSLQKAQYMKNVAEYFLKNTLDNNLKLNNKNIKEKDLLEIKNEEEDKNNFDFFSMSDEEIINTLTKIKGVGRWTVEMILISTLGRGDVFAIKDGGLISGVVKLYKLEDYHPKLSKDTSKVMKTKDFENKILEITKEWSPYRSIASLYIWKYKDKK